MSNKQIKTLAEACRVKGWGLTVKGRRIIWSKGG